MIEVLSRLEFAKLASVTRPHQPFDPDVLWYPERRKERGVGKVFCCHYFICVRKILEEGNTEFWDWTKEALQGETSCFASDDFGRKEWWGFTNKDDILIFVLRWA
jgi:hypothetical protein